MREKTIPQVLVAPAVDGQLAKRQPRRWDAKVRDMRKDATLSFARKLLLAPLLATQWTVVSDKPQYSDAVDYVYASTVPHKTVLVRNGLRGELDWGWQAFEKVYGFTHDSRYVIKKYKPLLQDITTILVEENGDIAGVRNQPISLKYASMAYGDPQRVVTWPWVDLWRHECLVFSHDVEGTDWYGSAIMLGAERAYDSWLECDDAARRYDTKIAGANWVVYYPIGHSVVDGLETDNYEVAKTILNSLESSGKIAVPMAVAQQIEDLNSIDESKRPWKVELLSASGSSESSFVGRQRYLDSLKVRALGIPERAVLEGQFGTKAEAEEHADFAITYMEMLLTDLVEQLNKEVVNPLLELNHGRGYVDKVRVLSMPLTDAKRARLRQLYSSYISTEAGQAEEFERIDWDALRENLEIPVRDETGTTDTSERSPDQESSTQENDNGEEQQAAATGPGGRTSRRVQYARRLERAGRGR